jgi:large subunit ribosomal protein L35
MSKLKTNSSAKKRFKITASGKILRKKAGKRHNLSKKSQSRIRSLRKSSILSESITKNVIKFLMPYGK